MKSIAILQSNYIPWQGYFDLIRAVDEFVILDTVQFTRNDWRNRNRIQTNVGPAWLTIPIRTANRFPQRIVDTEVSGPDWALRHWQTLRHSYARARSFNKYASDLEAAYKKAGQQSHLSNINRIFRELVCGWLGIETPISSSDTYPDHIDPVERLIAICRAAGAGRYLSGPRAKSYLDPNRFVQNGIKVDFLDYSRYPNPRLSVLDGVLNS